MRHLMPLDIDQMIDAYCNGATLGQLATQFGIHRETVANTLEERGVPRRYRLLSGERLTRAIALYELGQSLASVASAMGVSAETVRTAFIRAGVPTRPRKGWSH